MILCKFRGLQPCEQSPRPGLLFTSRVSLQSQHHVLPFAATLSSIPLSPAPRGEFQGDGHEGLERAGYPCLGTSCSLGARPPNEGAVIILWPLHKLLIDLERRVLTRWLSSELGFKSKSFPPGIWGRWRQLDLSPEVLQV